ncbi:conserved oligomeric Golgi complex subunit 5 [Coccinella septempunctata]|uniref:conserved oligomeric Golgi complex subunit 5 n=1 Tax=Coccinella septempunctata TaxID=41139 RepID=UPI001D074E34|nr:conserved oligomeric Golgi complex subunit 5 [Coccinella septempunctata]
MEGEVDLIGQLENDDFFSHFLSQDSNSEFCDHIAISDKVKKLGEGIESITKELQKCVLDKYEDLLKQADHATKLENILSLMNSHVYNLVANAEKLRNQINVPYEALSKHTQVLGRLHLASHILRQVSRIQQLSKRLSNTSDPSQKALILQELEQLASDEDLKDIHTVTAELRNIRTQQQKVVQLATVSLNQGIINENSVQTTSALQIFINLGTINKVLDNLISSTLSECKQSITYAFESASNTKSKAGQGRISLSSSQGFRTKIWTELEKAFSEDIHQHCKQVKFLQSCLNNLNLQDKEIEVAAKFWSLLGKIIQEQINAAPYSIQQMLEEDYPRLLRCYLDISKKLNYEYFTFDRTVLEKCETAYLSTSLTTLLDPTQEMFSVENCVAPSTDDIDKIVRIISSNLSVALIEENLSRKISKNVSKCIKMFAVKTEQQLDTGPDSAQVIGGNANIGQQKNVQLANRLNYFQRQIQRILSNMNESLSNSKIEIIYDALNGIDVLSGAIMQPLVVSINSTVETIIVTIHVEADWTKLPAVNKQTSCSPYMRELGQFITRVFNTYLAQFENKEVLLSKCSEIAMRCIELFVRHTTLLRPSSPITEGGRQRLRADYVYLESALKILCPNLSELGRPYKLLKAMTSLITLSPTEIIDSYTEGSIVPPSTVLLLLFSHAGTELASPHQNTGWSLQKLSAWLDQHQSESDRLDLMAGALQRYEALIRQKNSVNYDPVYPLMSQFLEKVIKANK